MALRAGQLAATAIREATSGEIVSVYRSAINLLLDSGRLIALLIPRGPIHPWAFDGVWWSENIRKGMPVGISDGILSIDRFELRIDSIPIVDLALRRKCRFVADEPRRRLGEIVSVFEPENIFNPVISNCLEQYRSTGNIAFVASALGVGSGLTPSGDDILVGVLAALDLTSEKNHGNLNDLSERSPNGSVSSDRWRTKSPASRLRKNLVSALPASLGNHTTMLSAQMLEAAISGHYPEPLVTLCDVLVDSFDEANLIRAANAVERLGHESGRALLSGFVMGLETVEKFRGLYNPHIYKH